MKHLIPFLATTLLLSGCVSREKCTLPPISDNVFDINKIPEKNLTLTSGNNIDSLVFINKFDSYEAESIKTLMNYRECEHSKGYNYNHRGETIEIVLRKNEDEKLTLDVYGFVNLTNFGIEVTESDILKNKEFIFEADTTFNSTIKEVVIKGFQIETITTRDNKKWTIKKQ